MAEIVAVNSQAELARSELTAEEVCKYLVSHKKQLLSIITRFETDPDTAEDLLSMVAVEALGSLNKFKGNCAVSTYLGAIAKNLAIDHVRRAVSRKSGAQIFYAHELASKEDQNEENGALTWEDGGMASFVTPEATLEWREMLHLVDTALPQLERRHPAAFSVWKLHRVDGLDYKEIEAQTGTPPRIAFLHVHRIGEALKEMVEKKAKSRIRK